MASSQEPGVLRLYKKTPSGNAVQITQQRVEQLAPAGGAPDGSPASVVTPEKLLSIDSNETFNVDDVLLVTFEPDTAGDGIDASDCIWSVPLVTASGSTALGRAQFQDPAFNDVTLIANEQTIAGYKANQQFRLSGKIFMDMQDDTA